MSRRAEDECRALRPLRLSGARAEARIDWRADGAETPPGRIVVSGRQPHGAGVLGRVLRRPPFERPGRVGQLALPVAPRR